MAAAVAEAVAAARKEAEATGAAAAEEAAAKARAAAAEEAAGTLVDLMYLGSVSLRCWEGSFEAGSLARGMGLLGSLACALHTGSCPAASPGRHAAALSVEHGAAGAWLHRSATVCAGFGLHCLFCCEFDCGEHIDSQACAPMRRSGQAVPALC